jgi:phosphatidate cytidylyltransferase
LALNLQTFKTRTLTAIVFVIVMLGGLFYSRTLFIVLFTFIHVGCLYEYINLINRIFRQKKWLYYFLAILYISLPVTCLVHLGISSDRIFHELNPTIANGYFIPIYALAVIFSIWINDTMAYIVGSFIGKTPFSSISPKKTWEGTIGGALLCVVVIASLGYSLKITSFIHWYHWAIIALLCAVFGTLGDLLESKLKRMAGVKDSGQIMPGHGGFLDRFDSLLIATPVVWLYIKLCNLPL